MTFLTSTLARLSQKSTSVVAINMPIDSWCRQLHIQPTRFVRKVELCTAVSTGDDSWGIPIDKSHLHTLLRVSLMPIPSGSGAEEDVLLIERVLSNGGAFHSVAPISEMFSSGGTLFHPNVHDRICIVSDGPATTLLHHLEVERTLEFGHRTSQIHLTLAQLGQILELVSRTTALVCAGGDCKYQSRSFAFTCMSALSPCLPPSTSKHKRGEDVSMNGSGTVDDLDFQLCAQSFLSYLPLLVSDVSSREALSWMVALMSPKMVH